MLKSCEKTLAKFPAMLLRARRSLRLTQAEDHFFFERFGFFFFSVDQGQNLGGQDPLTGDESITVRIGLREVHLFARKGLEFHDLGFCQIPHPFQCGVRIHT